MDSKLKRAEKEEIACCEKSKTRSIYLNSVVNSIKKLRNEAKESGASNRVKNYVPQGTQFVPKGTPGTPFVPHHTATSSNMLTTHMQTLYGNVSGRYIRRLLFYFH